MMSCYLPRSTEYGNVLREFEARAQKSDQRESISPNEEENQKKSVILERIASQIRTFFLSVANSGSGISDFILGRCKRVRPIDPKLKGIIEMVIKKCNVNVDFNKKELLTNLTSKFRENQDLKKALKNISKDYLANEMALLADAITSPENRSSEDIVISLLNAVETIINDRNISTFRFPLPYPKEPVRPGPEATVDQLKAYIAEYEIYSSRINDPDIIDLYGGRTPQECENIYNTLKHNLYSGLKTGDIIFFKLKPKEYTIRSVLDPEEYIDYGILKGQALAKAWMNGDSNEESHSYIHVGMIIKDGDEVYLAEATPSDEGEDVKRTKLDAFVIDSTSKLEYHVVRPKKARKEAGHLAGKITDAVETIIMPNSQPAPICPTRSRYSMAGAIISLFRNSKMGINARRRIFLTYAQLMKNGDSDKFTPQVKGKNRKFFCSYFIGFCLQNAYYSNQINEYLSESDRQKLTGIDANDHKALRSWAIEMEERYRCQFKNKSLKAYKFDPKNITPQKLRAYIYEHPEEFESVCRIRGKASNIK